MLYAAPLPFLHLLLHIDALLLQQLPLSEGPVHWFGGGLCGRSLLPLCAGLLGVVEPEHMVLSHDNTVA